MKKERSRVLDFLDGYEIPKEHKNAAGVPLTGKTFFSRSFSGRTGGILVFPRFFSVIKRAIKLLVYTSTRVYGTMLLFFGALVSVSRLMMGYLGVENAWSYTELSFGLAMTLIGVGLMFIDKPLGLALENFALTDYILFEFFCIKRMQKSTAVLKGYSSLPAIVVGALLATVGSFVHPGYVIAAVGILLFSLLALASPEFSLLFTVIAIPYIRFFDQTLISVTFLLVMTVISFTRKVMAGKRVLVIEQYDVLIGIMLLFVLASGIFQKGMESFEGSLMIALGAVGYVLAGNMITNRRLADRFALATCISAFPISVYVITRVIVNATDGVFLYEGEGFYSPEILSAFIVVAGLFTFSGLKELNKKREKIWYFIFLAVNLGAVVCLLNYTAFAVLGFCIAAYFILKLRHHIGLYLVLLCLVPYSLFLLPSSLLLGNAVADAVIGIDAEKHLEIWRAAFKVLGERPFLGIGMGEESFSSEIARFGITVPNSRNLFLELACEAGVFASVFLIALLLTAARHRSVYRRYVKHSEVRTASKVTAVSTVALVVFSTVTYLWRAYEMCFVFFYVLGFGSASLRIAKREYDERKLYYNDNVSSESSDIDVQLDGIAQKK